MPYGPGAAKAFRIATARCKAKGYSSFKKGTKGALCRSNIAEGVGRTMKRRR